MELSNLYNVQDVYSRLVDDFIHNRQWFKKTKTRNEDIDILYELQFFFQHFTNLGRQILDIYDETLEFLEKKIKPDIIEAHSLFKIE